MDDPDWFHGQLDPRNIDAFEGAWAATTISLYELAKLTAENMRSAAMQIPHREGAIELLSLFEKRVIISFGIEALIQMWLEERRIDCPVAATRVHFDDDGVVCGRGPNPCVPISKEIAADIFRQRTGVREENLLVIGDHKRDIHMMHPGGFNVLIVPPGAADEKLAAFREGSLRPMWDVLTMVIIGDSLRPLHNFIQEARAANR